MVRKKMIIVMFFIGGMTATVHGSYPTDSMLSALAPQGDGSYVSTDKSGEGNNWADDTASINTPSLGSHESTGYGQQDQARVRLAEALRSDETQAEFSQRRFNDCVRWMSCPQPGETFGQRRNRVLFCSCMILVVGGGLSAVTLYLVSKFT